MLNVVALQGRLARDPELRQTNTGKQVATFTLAVDRGPGDDFAMIEDEGDLPF